MQHRKRRLATCFHVLGALPDGPQTPRALPDVGSATVNVEPRLVLASASPRRARILRDLGVPYRVVVSNVDEALHPGEDGASAVERLARAKALAVARRRVPAGARRGHRGPAGRPHPRQARGRARRARDAAASGRPLARGRHGRVPGERRRRPFRCRAQRRGLRAHERRRAGLVRGHGRAARQGGGLPRGRQGALSSSQTVEGSPSNVAGLPVRLLLTLVREAGLDVGLPRA